MEDWYPITTNQLLQLVLYLEPVFSTNRKTPPSLPSILILCRKLLWTSTKVHILFFLFSLLFPTEYDWKPWKFNNVPPKYWEDPKNQRKFFENLSHDLQIQKMEDWYNVSVQVASSTYLCNPSDHQASWGWGNPLFTWIKSSQDSQSCLSRFLSVDAIFMVRIFLESSQIQSRASWVLGEFRQRTGYIKRRVRRAGNQIFGWLVLLFRFEKFRWNFTQFYS